MQKKFKISVDGRSYNVVVEELTTETGYAHPVSVPAEMLTPVSLAVPVEAPPPPVAAPKAAAAPGDEVAPLAGVIESIDVRIGQVVAIGDRIVTIEAMKMKTEVFAKHSGTVTNIVAKISESVDTGQVLLTVG